MKLRLTNWQLAICKLPSPSIPLWAEPSCFLNLCVTPTEISLVCEQRLLPNHLIAERDWGCLMVDGTLDFSLTGFIASITDVLAKVEISVFVISTYDTDYILIRKKHIDHAINVLQSAGYLI